MQGTGPLRPPPICEEGGSPPLRSTLARGRTSGAPLCTPQSGSTAPTPSEGRALRPSTPGDFPVAGKVTKGAPRAVPFGIPQCVVTALFALAYASRRATFCHKNRPICHFELVSKSVLFFLWFHQGNTLCFQSVARQIPYLRGCREPFYPQPIPLGQKARGSKGARPPSPEVKTSSKSRTRRSLAYLSQHLCCCFPLREKVGRGAEHGKAMLSRSARIRVECRGAYAPSLNRWVPSCSCLMGMASPGARSRSSSERQMPKISMSPGCRSLSSISQTSWV